MGKLTELEKSLYNSFLSCGMNEEIALQATLENFPCYFIAYFKSTGKIFRRGMQRNSVAINYHYPLTGRIGLRVWEINTITGKLTEEQKQEIKAYRN